MMSWQLNRIVGSEKVTTVFGNWPSFHDAEVVRVELDRKGSMMTVQLYTFDMTKETDQHGRYKQTKHCLVTLRLQGIEELELRDFNAQNVIGGLGIESDGELIRVVLEPSYGLNGQMACREIEVVTVEPTIPKQ